MLHTCSGLLSGRVAASTATRVRSTAGTRARARVRTISIHNTHTHTTQTLNKLSFTYVNTLHKTSMHCNNGKV